MEKYDQTAQAAPRIQSMRRKTSEKHRKLFCNNVDLQVFYLIFHTNSRLGNRLLDCIDRTYGPIFMYELAKGKV